MSTFRVQGRTTRHNIREATKCLDVSEVKNHRQGFRLRRREEQLTRTLKQNANLFVEVGYLQGEITNLSRLFSIRSGSLYRI
jgi:hypothetical protein